MALPGGTDPLDSVSLASHAKFLGHSLRTTPWQLGEGLRWFCSEHKGHFLREAPLQGGRCSGSLSIQHTDQ